MAKLKDGEKVEQSFTVATKFKVQNGNTRFKASHIKAYLNEALTAEYGRNHGVSIIAREEVPA